MKNQIMLVTMKMEFYVQIEQNKIVYNSCAVWLEIEVVYCIEFH